MAEGRMNARERAARALTKALESVQGAEALDAQGYARDATFNLVAPMSDAQRGAFESGKGAELQGKMRAPYSSSALAFNSFAPFTDAPSRLELAGGTGFDQLEFERQCPSGLRGTPPHLDVVASSSTHVVAVESKCLEYFTPKVGEFSDAYTSITDARSASRWFRHVAAAAAPQHLDIAQLVKHVLGLRHTFPERAITLLYLYWEPSNWREVPACVEHRAELQRFAYSVAGDEVRFASLSYPDLWDAWRTAGVDSGHLEKLAERYVVEM